MRSTRIKKYNASYTYRDCNKCTEDFLLNRITLLIAVANRCDQSCIVGKQLETDKFVAFLFALDCLHP